MAMNHTENEGGASNAGPACALAASWEQARRGVSAALSQWQVEQGGHWEWQPDGVSVASTGTDWASLRCQDKSPLDLTALGNIVIGLTVSGKAEAAGLSFGHFKDFLTRLDAPGGRRHLQLELDFAGGCWRFRVDGQLQDRCWWDSAIAAMADLTDGAPSFKAKAVEKVVFQDLTVHAFAASCQLSVIITCYRFLQRLRVSLRGWCHQTAPHGAYEVLVVNPDSPDGTHEHLRAVAGSYPHLRVREVPVGHQFVKNKGAMINRAVQASRGQWIWLTDSDCLFAPSAADQVLRRVEKSPPRLYYGQRRHLGQVETDALLAGRLDPVRDFEELCRRGSPRPAEEVPWGYTQIVPRSTLERFPYHEGHNHFAHTDGMFLEECKRRGVRAERIDGLFCLHLDHPFAWYGTDMFL
jgi:hypothetical protein